MDACWAKVSILSMGLKINFQCATKSSVFKKDGKMHLIFNIPRKFFVLLGNKQAQVEDMMGD